MRHSGYCERVRAVRVILIALLLSACSQTPRPVKLVTQEVKVPVVVPCVSRETIDRIEGRKPVPIVWTGEAVKDVQLATAQGLVWREVALDALAVLGVCAAPLP